MPPAGQNDSRYVRIERPHEIPPAEEQAVDVAVLDMNHGWPNLGHDSLVRSLLEENEDLLRLRHRTGVHLRVLSFDVRRHGMLPELPGGRYTIYLGTGGPGHLDPHRNDGVTPGCQGIREDPSWEAPLFQLFDAIQADPGAVLLAVCHSFGVMCRWSGIARPELRGAEKGGKSSGVLESMLTPEAEAHPWFSRFFGRAGGELAAALAPGGRLLVLDNRLFDLLPWPRPLPPGTIPIGYETLGAGGPRGDALTMAELARDRDGTMPRVFGVNHHPEIVDRPGLLELLEAKLRRGEVSGEWVAERREILSRQLPDGSSDARLKWTTECTLWGPLRYFAYRQLRRRAEALGHQPDLHEDRLLDRMTQTSA